EWTAMDTSARIGFAKERISVYNVQLGSNGQSILVNGALSSSATESLTVAIRNLDLASLGRLYPARGLPQGILNLNCTLSHSLTRPEVGADLTATGLRYGAVNLGTVRARMAFRDSTVT